MQLRVGKAIRVASPKGLQTMNKRILTLCSVVLLASATAATYASTITTGTTGTLDLNTTALDLSGQGNGAVTTILEIQDNGNKEAVVVSGCVGFNSTGSVIDGVNACGGTGGTFKGPDTAIGGNEAP